MSLRNRWILFGILLGSAIILAPLALKFVNNLLIEPIAYYWWGVKQLIRTIPQVVYWFFLITCLGLIVVISLLRQLFSFKETDEAQSSQDGPVETLAESIGRTQKSSYFKWLLANRLASLTLNMMQSSNEEGPDHNGKNQRDFSHLNWDPPPDVKGYLEAGINSSSMGYRKKGWFSRQKTNKYFDTDLDKVIEYIEAQID